MKMPTPVRKSTLTTFCPHLESLESRLTPAAVTVSSLADSGAGSLRAAITSVNSFTADEIDFSVSGVIKLTSGPLPTIASTVKIDGTTAPGFAGAPVVEIDNNGFAGLINTGNSSIFASLCIVNANGAGLTLEGAGGSHGGPSFGLNITVVGNYIGLALDGSVAPNTGDGLLVDGSKSDTIGGTAAVDRNVISGNGADGIELGSANTTVTGNFIGTDPTGQSAAPNRDNGINAINGAGNTIGGSDQGAANIIAFNTEAGVFMNPENGVLINSIYSNGFKGIDVEQVSLNIPIMGIPLLTYAMESPGSTTGSAQVQVGGVVNVGKALPQGAAGLPITIQVFATLSGVPAGQGQVFLGSVQVTANPSGFAAFTLSNVSAPAGSGTTFTAIATTTAIDAALTSEFSSALSLGGNPNTQFVASAYGLLLNRYSDTGAAFWVNLLNNGDSAASVVLGIEGSTEYLSDQVSAMYKLYLQRGPDAAGEQAWNAFLQAGGALEQVAAGLVSSREYFVLQGGTNQGFIGGTAGSGQAGGLYEQVLNRFPTTGEIAGWETALDNGVSRYAVSLAFLTSQEYRADLVENDYIDFLQRTVDSGGLTHFVDALNAGATDQQLVAVIFGSPEGYQLWS